MGAIFSITFHYFIYYNSDQYGSTNYAHMKTIIKEFSQHNLLVPWLRKICENTDNCAEQYRCATALFISYFLSNLSSVIIDLAISDPGHGKNVLYGINDVYKNFSIDILNKIQFPDIQENSNIFFLVIQNWVDMFV